MIDHLEHLVPTTSHEADGIRFYRQALRLRLENFVAGTPPEERKAFVFGAQKINLHLMGREFEPNAQTPMPGAPDLCFIAALPLVDVIARLQAASVLIIEGPELRTGTTGPIRLLVARDPDLNLIEISEPA
jgi:catechol 2,3-dioxygenase-like lactoylglutathione lyase family enzyme